VKLGQISKYEVVRETKLGYMLSDGKSEYFLHNNECNDRVLNIGEEVEAFLYVDKKKRIATTLFPPKITVNQGGLCEVINSNQAGLFIDIGISRDILLSSDDLEKGKWPEIGDYICGRLHARGNNLFVKLLNKEEIIKLSTGVELEIGEKYKGYVYRITKQGINIVDENYNIIFVYFKNLRKDYRIGEEVEVKITRKNNDDYSGTLIPQKEIMINEDAEKIYKHLLENNGVMNYGGKTPPDVIYKVFKMSKAAFKRALGNLYKQQKVVLEDNKTILIKEEDYE